MPHYDFKNWADFARGLLTAGERIRMERHLSEGCAACGSELAFFEKVARAGVGVREVIAPEDVVRKARNIFPARRKPAVHEAEPLLARLRARLVYDSFADLAPAGIRSGKGMSRQLMYEVEDYSVDLRLDGDRDSTLVSVVGQIANRTAPASRVNDSEVSLLSGKSLVSKTRSNGFGEFWLEFAPKRNMKLCIAIPNGAGQVEVPMNRLVEEHPAS